MMEEEEEKEECRSQMYFPRKSACDGAQISIFPKKKCVQWCTIFNLMLESSKSASLIFKKEFFR
jgi:hypothetical protein